MFFTQIPITASHKRHNHMQNMYICMYTIQLASIKILYTKTINTETEKCTTISKALLYDFFEKPKKDVFFCTKHIRSPFCPKFRYHGMQGKSRVNLKNTIRLAVPANYTIEPKITTVSYTQPKL